MLWTFRRDGFGNVNGEYWLGLQPLYLLTNSGIDYTFKVGMILRNDTSFQQHYRYFKVGEEASRYQLYFSQSNPNPVKPLGDSLSSALGSFFSTHDADHDGDVTENCALRHQSGWWFPSTCNLTEGNPLGRLMHPLDNLWSGKPEDVFWTNDLGDVVPWKVRLWLTRV